MIGNLHRLLAVGAVIAAIMAVSTETRADFVSGNKLYETCTSSEVSSLLICDGYTEAIFDAAGQPPNGVLGWEHCGRGGVTLRQVEDIVVRFLRTHPEKRDFGAAGLVGQAVAEAFPCQK